MTDEKTVKEDEIEEAVDKVDDIVEDIAKLTGDAKFAKASAFITKYKTHIISAIVVVAAAVGYTVV